MRMGAKQLKLLSNVNRPLFVRHKSGLIKCTKWIFPDIYLSSTLSRCGQNTQCFHHIVFTVSFLHGFLYTTKLALNSCDSCSLLGFSFKAFTTITYSLFRSPENIKHKYTRNEITLSWRENNHKIIVLSSILLFLQTHKSHWNVNFLYETIHRISIFFFFLFFCRQSKRFLNILTS